jgi:hypothetical protein
MRASFEKIKKVIESCVILQQIKPCNELLSLFKTTYLLPDEDGCMIMLNEILKQKEIELFNNFTL